MNIIKNSKVEKGGSDTEDYERKYAEEMQRTLDEEAKLEGGENDYTVSPLDVKDSIKKDVSEGDPPQKWTSPRKGAES